MSLLTGQVATFQNLSKDYGFATKRSRRLASLRMGAMVPRPFIGLRSDNGDYSQRLFSHHEDFERLPD
jgi:hypothetical protein